VSKKVIAAIVAVAVVLVVGLVVWQLQSGDDAPQTAAEFEGTEEVAALLQGIPQDGRVLGEPDAPVTIAEYIDFKCPVCAAASEGVVPELIEKYVRPGTVKLEVRPIAFLGPDSERGALGLEAAALQDRAWQFTELLLKNQGNEAREWITDEVVLGAAGAAGADTARFEEDYRGEAVGDAFVATKDQARADGVSGTPFWVVSGPGEGTSFSGNADIARFDQAIAAARGDR
jgi:protein-disulfide isomerase